MLGLALVSATVVPTAAATAAITPTLIKMERTRGCFRGAKAIPPGLEPATPFVARDSAAAVPTGFPAVLGDVDGDSGVVFTGCCASSVAGGAAGVSGSVGELADGDDAGLEPAFVFPELGAGEPVWACSSGLPVAGNSAANTNTTNNSTNKWFLRRSMIFTEVFLDMGDRPHRSIESADIRFTTTKDTSIPQKASRETAESFVPHPT